MDSFGEKPLLRAVSDNDATEAIGDLIHDLFAVGLTLAACAAIVEPDVAARLKGATAEVDDVIRRLRRSVFDETTGAAPSVRHTAHFDGEHVQEIGETIDVLHRLADDFRQFADAGSSDQGALDLAYAAYRTQCAVHSLEQVRLSMVDPPVGAD